MEKMEYEPSEYDINRADNDAEEYDRFLHERFSGEQSFEHWQKALPPILFKYRSIETAKNLVRMIDILKEHRLYLSAVTSLNDPFEGGNVDYLNDADKDEFEEEVKNCRVLSLSENCFSVPLWAHYANECKGVCIGFLTFDTLSCADKLNYSNTIDKRLWWSVDKTDALRKEFLYKNQDWEYESEYRLIETTTNSTDEYLDFKPNEMTVIIFGKDIDKDVKKTLKDIIPDNVLVFDINSDKNRSRYYLTECDSYDLIAYTLDDLYKIVFKK